MAKWAALVGAKGSGKSVDALDVARRLQTRGARVGGFVQRSHTDALDRKSYELVRLACHEAVSLARPGAAEGPGLETHCSWIFESGAFDKARGWLLEDAPACDVLFVDEVSKVEVGGRGNHDALRAALALDDSKLVVVCIRADQLFYVVDKIGLGDAAATLECPADDCAKDGFVAEVLAAVRARA
jgi:nucleoside-triphosphatase THEP1